MHYDSDPNRRPLYHRLVAERVLGGGYALEEGAGLVYRGTELAQVVTDIAGNRAYRLDRQSDGSVAELALDARLLS